jgi:hypothetical protein
MSTTRSLASGSPRSASTVIWSPSSRTSTLQARRLAPLMSMASDPQIPCAQERRKVSDPSMFHFT